MTGNRRGTVAHSTPPHRIWMSPAARVGIVSLARSLRTCTAITPRAPCISPRLIALPSRSMASSSHPLPTPTPTSTTPANKDNQGVLVPSSKIHTATKTELLQTLAAPEFDAARGGREPKLVGVLATKKEDARAYAEVGV